MIRLKKTIYSAQVTDLLRVMNKSLSVALVRNPTYTPASSPASRESVRDGPTHTHTEQQQQHHQQHFICRDKNDRLMTLFRCFGYFFFK